MRSDIKVGDTLEWTGPTTDHWKTGERFDVCRVDDRGIVYVRLRDGAQFGTDEGCAYSEWRHISAKSATDVRAGDIVRDVALLKVGMRLSWACGGGCVHGDRIWRTDSWPLGVIPEAPHTLSHIDGHGVRIVSLPDMLQPIVSAPKKPSFYGADPVPVPIVGRCTAACAPASACLAHDKCPGYREMHINMTDWSKAREGIAADWTPQKLAPPELRCEAMWQCGLVRTK